MASGSQNMTTDKARQAFYLEAPHQYGFYTDEYGNFICKNDDPESVTCWHLDNNAKTISSRYYWDTGDLYLYGKLGIGYDPTTSGNTYKLYVNGSIASSSSFTAKGNITTDGGMLKSVANGNTITIGSQNSSFTHIYNSANIPFIFNNTVETTSGNLGSTSYPWNNIYIGKANGAGIYYQGSKANYRMIRFIDNTGDTYGNGISIGGGGQTIIGGGESADTAAAQVGTGGSEVMYVCNDGNVDIISNLQNGWDSRKVMTFNTSGYLMLSSYINSPTSNNENPTVSQFIVTNGSDHYYRKASTAHAMAAIRGAASGTWGINITGNAATASRATYANYLSNASHSVTIGTSGWGASNPWNAGNRTLIWGQYGKSSVSSDTADMVLYYGTHANAGGAGFFLHLDGGVWSMCGIYTAVWNDFAEYRVSDVREPGYVIAPASDGKNYLTTERMQSGARIISDTFGQSVGYCDEARTPLGVSGRVLAYPARAREEYKIGDCVCASPGGKVDIMTREEIMMYPDRIIGIVNEIPNYDVWERTVSEEGGGAKTHHLKTEVKGRIWIDIR